MNDQKLISVKDFSPEELRKWQLKLLEILVYFRDFCQAHQLRFFLSAGTCLGAIRHKGFIPWDDDLDVQMPRPDYDKLIEIWDKEADTSKFVCSVTTKDECSRFPMAVIRSVNTTCIYEHSVNDDFCQGLKIDVEFLDGVPDGVCRYFWANSCAKLLALVRAQRVPNRKSGLLRMLSKLILKFLPKPVLWHLSVFLEKQIKKVPFDGNVKWVRYLTCKGAAKSCFNTTEWVDFEGYKMPIPGGYDQYLRNAYGDYMQLPPEKSRVPATDNLVFYDLDHCYLDYKGIQYCKSKK